MMSPPWFPAQPVRLEQVVRNAPFSVYGLAEAPDDLMLHAVGYSTVDAGWGETTPRSAPPSLDVPRYLWQVNLGYSSPQASGAWFERLEVCTTAVTQPPAEAPAIEQLRKAYTSHYSSDDDAPQLNSRQALLIEHFTLIDQDAVLVVNYSPDPKPASRPTGVPLGGQRHELAEPLQAMPTLVPAPPPTWSFIFRAAAMWVDVQAYGWTQQDIFPLLRQLVALNARPDVVARSEREVTRWEQALGWHRNENEA